MKIKCKHCLSYFEKPDDHKRIVAFGVSFCSLRCRRDFVLAKQKKEKEKQLAKLKKEKLETKKKEKREKEKIKRSTSPKVLINKADEIFSKYIRLRDSLKTTGTPDRCVCITCGKTYETKKIHNGHFASRRFYQTRWDEKNCNAQCYMCNVGMGGEQYKHGQKIDEMYGTGTAESIMQKARKVQSLELTEVQEVINITTIKYKDLQNNLKVLY